MLESVMGRVVNGVVSFASLAFSSFKGNDAELSIPFITQNRNQIVIESNLKHAFEQDFYDIFRSGKEIEVWFSVTVEGRGHKLIERNYAHKAKFNPMTRDFNVVLQEQNYTFTTGNYTTLVNAMSHFEYTWNWRQNASPGQNVNVTVISYMKKIKLDAYREDFDLMMLWKFRKPKVQRGFQIAHGN
jgi:hypothetical protein